MKNTLKISVLSAIVWIVFANLPAGWFSIKFFAPKYGNVGITTISTATNLAAFPAIYNTDIPALDNGKIDVSSTSIAAITTLGGLTSASSLASVGTLTSGTLGAGFTAVNVAQGGTGSTTLSSNQVLLGNGTGNVKTPIGWGTSGQALISNGGVLAPTWQSASFDLTQNYAVTGIWTFSNTANVTGSALLKTLIASSTIQINNGGAGVSYSFPTSQGAASTTLFNNGSGTLTWQDPGGLLYATSTVGTLIKNSTTEQNVIATSTIPANTLGTQNIVHIKVPLLTYSHLASGSGGANLTLNLYYGSSIVCVVTWDSADTLSGISMAIDGYISEKGTTSSQNCILTAVVARNSQSNIPSSATPVQTPIFTSTSNSAVDDTVAQPLRITAQWGAASNSDSLQSNIGGYVEKIF